MTEINPEHFILLPLPLAELLHVTLGPLANVLEEQDHPWVPLIRKVLGAYQDGRDDMVFKMYGKSVTDDIGIITWQVSEELVKWVAEMADEEVHFEKWKEELGE